MKDHFSLANIFSRKGLCMCKNVEALVSSGTEWTEAWEGQRGIQDCRTELRCSTL